METTASDRTCGPRTVDASNSNDLLPTKAEEAEAERFAWTKLLRSIERWEHAFGITLQR